MFRLADGRCYVGETDALGRRFQNYRAPGPGQPTNLCLNRELVTALRTGCAVTVDVISAASADGAALDLRSKLDRVLVEHAILWAEARAGWRLLNL